MQILYYIISYWFLVTSYHKNLLVFKGLCYVYVFLKLIIAFSFASMV